LLNTVLGSLSSGVAASTSSYESIATVTATGGETSITFSSIVGTYASLQVRALVRNTSGTGGTAGSTVRFNGDTGSNYTTHSLNADGATAAAYGFASQTRIFIFSNEIRGGSTSDTFGTCIMDVHDYASSTKYKTLRAFGGGDLNSASPAGKLALDSGVWMSTSAITSLTITVGATAFAAGSTFALYGIKG
jgi:hypothetical protein